MDPLQQFKFQVFAFDAYFTGDLWDSLAIRLRAVPQLYGSLAEVPPGTVVLLGADLLTKPLYFLTPIAGQTASPSQTGLLFLYRDAPVGQESEHILLL